MPGLEFEDLDAKNLSNQAAEPAGTSGFARQGSRGTTMQCSLQTTSLKREILISENNRDRHS